MEKRHKKEVPKYLNLEGMSQYELANKIDKAISDADHQCQQNCYEESYQLLFLQCTEQFNDDFGLDLVRLSDQKLNFKDIKQLQSSLEMLIPQCLATIRQNSSVDHQGIVQLHASIDTAFADASDIIKAKNLWRFEIRRAMSQALEGLHQHLNKL